MKIKKYVPFLFMFLLLFVNIIPINVLTNKQSPMYYGGDQTLNFVYSLINSMSYTSYITGFFFIVILYLFIRSLVNYRCNPTYINFFTISFMLSLFYSYVKTETNVVMLTKYISHFTGSYSDPVVSDFYISVSLFLQWIGIILFILTVIAFILCILDIKEFLRNSMLVLGSTIVMALSTFIIMIPKTSNNPSSVGDIKFQMIMALLALFSIILFKISLVVEAMDFVRLYDRKEEKGL